MQESSHQPSRDHPPLSLREDRAPLQEIKCDRIKTPADQQRNIVDDDLFPIVRYLPEWGREFADFYAADNVRIARLMGFTGGALCTLAVGMHMALLASSPEIIRADNVAHKLFLVYWQQNYLVTIPTFGFIATALISPALFSLPRLKVRQHNGGDSFLANENHGTSKPRV